MPRGAYKAGQVLEGAERLWANERDVAEVEHLAYITEKRVEIARITAQRRLAADEIQPILTSAIERLTAYVHIAATDELS